jgi:hypothetical protein
VAGLVLLGGLAVVLSREFLAVRFKILKLRYETPHVCFRVGSPLPAVDDELVRRLEFQFRGRFKSCRFRKTWFFSAWVAVIQTEKNSHVVGVTQSKYDKSDWIITVSPSREIKLTSPESRHKARLEMEDIMVLCRELHAELSVIDGVSAICWYFEGTDNQSSAVWTPDELPWNLEHGDTTL